ncbi:desmoplakin [Artaxa digramma nucleopolyhedrovirus]|uniref:Desmoplakin n=1 Tax=Artaxa digramma nucleopolyhedrovirus TaxID=3070910 RepID=A0AAE6UZL2_9ABAC|nr:desmoplakin [Euproctis digramma nucleopolyhedrovirus]QHB21728.1 desmoplakin [Artaxa digramma nucleopolyhedrovirus]
MSNYRNIQPKYMNTDVNANTVKNLLNTINTITKQCKNQNATDNTLDRIRSIIHLYRPHLKLRYDLQITELVIEALAPSTTTPNQITHNFNYKYDYNTNMAPSTVHAPTFPPPPPPPQPSDPFGAPQFPINYASSAAAAFNHQNYSTANMTTTTTTPSPPLQRTPVQQNYYINPSPTSSAQDSRLFERVPLAQNDVVDIERQLSETPSTSATKQLIRTLINVGRKYISSETFFIAMERIYKFDCGGFENNNGSSSGYNGDIVSLINCINNKTKLNLNANNPQLCEAISSFIYGYYQLSVNIIEVNEHFSLDNIKSMDEINANTILLIRKLQALRQSYRETLDANGRLERELEVNNNDAAKINETMRVAETRYRSLEENYEMATSKIIKYENILKRMDNIVQINNPNESVFLLTPTSPDYIVSYFERLHAKLGELNDITNAQANQLARAKTNDVDMRNHQTVSETVVADLKSRLAAYGVVIKHAENVLRSKNVEYDSSTESAVEVLANEYRKALATVEDLQNQCSSETKDLKANVARLNKKITTLEDKIVGLQQDANEQTIKFNDKLKIELDNAYAERNAEIEKRVNRERATMSNMQKRIDSLEDDNGRLRENVETLRKEKAADALRLKQLQMDNSQQLVEMNNRLSALTEENAVLKTRQQSAASASEPLLSPPKRKQVKRDNVEVEVDTSNLFAEYENKDAYFEQLQKDINEVKNDLNRVIASSNMTGADFLALTSKINKTKIEECDRLKKQVANLKGTTDAAIADKAKEITKDIEDSFKSINSQFEQFDIMNKNIKKNVNQYRLNYESLARSAVYRNTTSEQAVTSSGGEGSAKASAVQFFEQPDSTQQ